MKTPGGSRKRLKSRTGARAGPDFREPHGSRSEPDGSRAGSRPVHECRFGGVVPGSVEWVLMRIIIGMWVPQLDFREHLGRLLLCPAIRKQAGFRPGSSAA